MVTDGEDPFTEPAAPGAGGRFVEQTGIALVHEGEFIAPAPGSEAAVSREAGAGTVVNYHFPVEVEVVGRLGDHHVRQIAEHVFTELDRELGSRA
ncbi:hypothetical protein [Streptomyces sp. 891-h]|uniref:hypothetical protein n=1 Tax=Streptomyces sp. 891-h TaxID=2720714 RepID=UPI001FA9F277|nr:hypothetical protein [Streptomyces sp. 891-h]UNZ21164.1 hypothetical protein HC362_32905 [Streptomyces sp. 891-h]